MKKGLVIELAQEDFYKILGVDKTATKEEIKKAYRLGANSFVVKPTEHEEFENKIEEIYHYWMDFTKLPRE